MESSTECVTYTKHTYMTDFDFQKADDEVVRRLIAIAKKNNTVNATVKKALYFRSTLICEIDAEKYKSQHTRIYRVMIDSGTHMNKSYWRIYFDFVADKCSVQTHREKILDLMCLLLQTTKSVYNSFDNVTKCEEEHCNYNDGRTDLMFTILLDNMEQCKQFSHIMEQYNSIFQNNTKFIVEMKELLEELQTVSHEAIKQNMLDVQNVLHMREKNTLPNGATLMQRLKHLKQPENECRFKFDTCQEMDMEFVERLRVMAFETPIDYAKMHAHNFKNHIFVHQSISSVMISLSTYKFDLDQIAKICYDGINTMYLIITAMNNDSSCINNAKITQNCKGDCDNLVSCTITVKLSDICTTNTFSHVLMCYEILKEQQLSQ